MKGIVLILTLSITLLSCEEGFDGSVPCYRGVEATLRDLSGLDGCGFVFVLNDGTKLEPIRLLYCGTPPLPKEVTEDPLFQLEWVDGKKVIIGYEVTKALNACMAGPIVKITCLTEVGTSQETDE
jgi:hypothetical protein